MTQLELVQAWLTHFTYKPGVNIAIRADDGVVRLHITHKSSDSTNGSPCTVRGDYSVPEFIESGRQFFLFLREALLSFERHELGEWFRIDGVAVFDPHADQPIKLRSLNEEKLRQWRSPSTGRT